MKKIIQIALLFTFFPAILIGQKLNKITNSEKNETYFVLKNNQSVKHWEYKKFSYDNVLLMKGYYKNGIKDSIWECYDQKGKITLSYDFSNNKVLLFNPSNKIKDKKYSIVNNMNQADTKLSYPPVLLGGDELFLSELLLDFFYPPQALENGISGKVYIVFTVDKFGKTSNYHIDKPLGYGLDEEAIRIIKSVEEFWLPGFINDQPVDVEVVFPINFQLH